MRALIDSRYEDNTPTDAGQPVPADTGNIFLRHPAGLWSDSAGHQRVSKLLAPPTGPASRAYQRRLASLSHAR